MSRRAHGFTLLELLVVLIIVSAIAGSLLVLSRGKEDQARFEDTRNRWLKLREAIQGNGALVVNGRPQIAGYVADMGTFPSSIVDLIDPRTSGPWTTFGLGTLPTWHYDPINNAYTGWRGPYLETTPEANGRSGYRDGWGNPGNPATPGGQEWDPNFGWIFNVITNPVFRIESQSLGADWNRPEENEAWSHLQPVR